jgi:hypothetical protein
MKIKQIDNVALLESCHTRAQQIFIENFIFTGASLPRSVESKIQHFSEPPEPLRDTNRSCVKQYIVEKFVMSCPYDQKRLNVLINNAIMFKHLQIKDLQHFLVELNNDSNVSCETLLKKHQAMSTIILELSKPLTKNIESPNILT